MILRRLTKHVKDQNWFTVALDFVIVAGNKGLKGGYRRETDGNPVFAR